MLSPGYFISLLFVSTVALIENHATFYELYLLIFPLGNQGLKKKKEKVTVFLIHFGTAIHSAMEIIQRKTSKGKKKYRFHFLKRIS